MSGLQDRVERGHDHEGHNQHGDAPSADATSEAFWDQRYQSSSTLWSGQVNPHLISEASELSPGSALDVGCGEGADAIWLAQQGWRVTAVDVSTVALERAAAHALEISAEVAQRITWLHADLTQWVPATASFDLVSSQFLHLPKEQRDVLHRRLAVSVAPGGTLLVVGHHPLDLQTTVPRPSVPGFLFAASEVADSLTSNEWAILVADARGRQTLDPDGRTATIHDSVFRATRVS